VVEDLPFKIVRTDARDEVIALAGNLLVGRAASCTQALSIRFTAAARKPLHHLSAAGHITI